MDLEKELPPLWEQKPLQNETGLYELYAVLTHKGRDADSGHYVAWTKQSDGTRPLLPAAMLRSALTMCPPSQTTGSASTTTR